MFARYQCNFQIGPGKDTRFSGSGGGQLDGLPPGAPGQYGLRQWMVDFAYFHRGFSMQGEQHFKKVIDYIARNNRSLRGGYLQAGEFPLRRWRSWPVPLEIAGRLAYVDPDTEVQDDFRTEATAAVNYYFNQHRNKVTAELSRLTAGTSRRTGGRFRLQWELSF